MENNYVKAGGKYHSIKFNIGDIDTRTRTRESTKQPEPSVNLCRN